MTKIKLTPSDIKYLIESDRDSLSPYFFERKTMKFFGDKMSSFRTKEIDGKVYLYRRPSASVNVFGTIKTAGKEFFGAWEFTQDPKTHLRVINGEEKEMVYNSL